MSGYLKLFTFVIVCYIQITKSQSINQTEIADKTNGTQIESTTAASNSTKPTFHLKPILFAGEELSYEDFLSRNPQRVEIKSTNYPDFFPADSSRTEELIAETGTGVDIIIHDIDLNPTTDFLYIRGNSKNDKGVMYTGQHEELLPIRIRILSTNSFTLQFVSGAPTNSQYRGFLLTYSSYGEIPTATETPTTQFPIADLPLQFTNVHLNITKEQQTNETWNILRTSLSEMANRYVEAENISASECLPEYVVLLINHCPSSWHNADSCVAVEFAVPVPIVQIDDDDKVNQHKINTTNFNYELTEYKLIDMWNRYAEATLSKHNISIFEKSSSLILLMWIGISLAVITAFLIVLYFIWRMDELNAYRRFRNKRSNSIVHDSNNDKPSFMEEQARSHLGTPQFFDEDLNENHENFYATTVSNNNLFVIADDDLYPTRPSFITYHRPSNQVQKVNGVPKSALKNTQFNVPAQYTDPNSNLDDTDVRITINPQSSLASRTTNQQLYLPDDPTFEESNS